MASLSSGERVFTLAAATTVGRDPGCGIVLPEHCVSGLHARITWSGDAWQIRDLGSTNGTFVNHVRLMPGASTPLGVGACIAFGDARLVWTLADGGAPVARALNLEDGMATHADAGVLVIGRRPEGAARLTEVAGRWTRVDGMVAVQMVDGQIIVIHGERWRVELPCVAVQTPLTDAGDGHGMALSFQVGDDEETLRLTIITAEAASVVPARTHHELLLLLCRARLADRMAGYPELQAGWRDVEDLCSELGTDETRINVEVHRLRKQLATYGFPASVIERRPGSGLVRVGVVRLTVGKAR